MSMDDNGKVRHGMHDIEQAPHRFSVRGRLLLGSELTPGAVVVEDGRVVAIAREASDGNLAAPILDAAIVAPGFVDLQVNGGFGVEVADDPEAIRALARRLPETGVTAFLPTLVTAPTALYPRAYDAFDRAKGAPGARPLGLHLEGPFLSPRRKGAHRADLIEAADPRLLDCLPGGDVVRLMTLAPERPGAIDRIRALRRQGIAVSLGHSDASFAAFERGVDAGATMATHLYNAMSPFAHRAPGVAGAALVDDRVTVGLIVDGIHSHPASVALAVRAKGAERVVLVTDMMSAAGMGPGEYLLGGQAVTVDDVAARVADGSLAGSIVTMDQAIRNTVAWGGVTWAQALRMATATPAGILGLDRVGHVRVGGDADLVLLDEGLRVRATIIAGRVVYSQLAVKLPHV